MPWEERDGKGHYFTSSPRVDGRVRREYYGAGPIGDLAEALCTLQRQKTAELAEAWNRETASLSEIDASFLKASQLTNELIRAALLSLGFRKHPTKWKFTRRRDEYFEPDGTDLDGCQLDELIRRAEEGDSNALAIIRKMLKEPDVWQFAWDATELALKMVVGAIAGTDPTLAEAIEGRLIALRKGRNGETPSYLKKLLVERLAVAWMSVIYAEALAVDAPERERTDVQKRYFHRRVTEARKWQALAEKLLGVVGKKIMAARKKKGEGEILAGPISDTKANNHVAPNAR